MQAGAEIYNNVMSKINIFGTATQVYRTSEVKKTKNQENPNWFTNSSDQTEL